MRASKSFALSDDDMVGFLYFIISLFCAEINDKQVSIIVNVSRLILFDFILIVCDFNKSECLKIEKTLFMPLYYVGAIKFSD